MAWLLLALLPVVAVFVYAYYQDHPEKFKRRAIRLGIFVVVAFISILCYRIIRLYNFDQEQFGKAYNAQRKALGLDTIPAKWVLETPMRKNFSKIFESLPVGYVLTYLNPDSSQQPLHKQKIISVTNGQLISEADKFYNGPEIITVSYSYIDKARYRDHFNRNTGFSYSNNQIDSVLRIWKNYMH